MHDEIAFIQIGILYYTSHGIHEHHPASEHVLRCMVIGIKFCFVCPFIFLFSASQQVSIGILSGLVHLFPFLSMIIK